MSLKQDSLVIHSAIAKIRTLVNEWLMARSAGLETH
jgi:hypothetical protein